MTTTGGRIFGYVLTVYFKQFFLTHKSFTMKALLVLIFGAVSSATFIPASSSATRQAVISTNTSADPFPCRQAFLLNTGTDTAVVQVQVCGGETFSYTLAPGTNRTTTCLSTAYGANVVRGVVLVDWMASCE
ncbi:hypothetical protein SAMN05428949_5623 [Chitinophaga sp. YR627]|nr:hypothetical protein SAMN05428949_5623 [Chitinophaga sp. YR627]